MNMKGRFSYVKLLYAGALAAGVLCAATAAVAAGHAHAFAHGFGSHALSVRAAHLAAPAHLAVPSRTAVPARSLMGRAVEAAQSAGRGVDEPLTDRTVVPGTTPFADRPWIEGYEPVREDALFRATYPLLPSHNVLKVYVSDASSFGSAGIRFSARVPHTQRDIDLPEMQREAVTLIRTAFDQFPDLQTVDVWATIPVSRWQATSVESTVFSVSADRQTYVAIRDRGLPDSSFLQAFGRVWVSPQVPQ